MSQKNFCDRCHVELDCLRGNHFAPWMFDAEGYRLYIHIGQYYLSSNDSDLCVDCTEYLIQLAVRDHAERVKQAAPKPEALQAKAPAQDCGK